MKRPSALYIVPTEGMAEGEEMESVAISGWSHPPQPGSICLVLPIKDADRLRQIHCLYRVTATSATGDREWPWELDLEVIPVPQPRHWYDLTEHVLRLGLVPLVGTYQSGDTITHEATLEAIFDLLGF